MSNGEAPTEKDFFPSIFEILLFQTDERFLMAFFRKDVGEWIWRPSTDVELALILAFAAAPRIFIETALAAQLGLPAVFPIAAIGLWIGFGVLVEIFGSRLTREVNRRARVGDEITPTYFIGWSRFLDMEKLDAADALKRSEMIYRANCKIEPRVGLSIAALTFFLSPLFGIWLAFNVLILAGGSELIFLRNRQQRLQLKNAFAEKASMQRLLEQIRQQELNREDRAILEGKRSTRLRDRISNQLRRKVA